MYSEFYNADELKKIRIVLRKIKEENIKDVDDYLKRHLNEKEIMLASIFIKESNKTFKLYKDSPYNKIDPSTIKIRKPFELVWEEITPYTILGIEEKKYTKEELLEIIGKKINFLLNHEIDKKNKKIDEILDAYNELTKESNKQR